MRILSFLWAGILFSSWAMAITISPAVQKELLRNPDIRNCYSRSESGQSQKKGRVIITLDVDRWGHVTSVGSNKKASSLKESALHSCLINSIQSLILPLSSKARGHKNTLPLRFPPAK